MPIGDMKVENTYHLNVPDMDKRGGALLVVLVKDARDTYAVYTGIVHLPDVSEDNYGEARAHASEMIAARGMKENFNRAVTYFPGLTKETYRA